MNMSLVISAIVGGLLMLAMIGLNTRVSQNAGIKTMQFATKSKVEALSGYLTADLRQVGAGITTGNKLEQITPNRITFRRTDRNGVSQQIQWIWDTNAIVPESPNPRDRRLLRISGGQVSDFGSGVVSFKLRYFNANGDSTLTMGDVRRIHVEVIMESNVPYINEWARSYWETDISPRSLQ
jgi:hypothetical protein